ncbi:unnamed protein product [Closterium sp. NIES-54]
MYWWARIRRDVKELVDEYVACMRNKAALKKAREELQSLPIRGLGYRWSLDLAGELPLSKKGKQYILVMVEHTSKWVEARALLSKNSGLIAEAFVEQVINMFGACGEVLTDQGTEFKGCFEETLGLRAYGETNKRGWDQALHWILAGYRFAKQAALKDMSPFHLQYGRHPILPVDAPKLLSATVDADEPHLWAELARKRATYLKELTPAALDNLHVPQLRDARRYQ